MCLQTQCHSASPPNVISEPRHFFQVGLWSLGSVLMTGGHLIHAVLIPVWNPVDNIAVLQLNIATSAIAMANLDDITGVLPSPTTTLSSEWVSASSPGGASEELSEGLDKPLENDAEGVWSPDIEQSFQEALAIYPPCGRRKIILSDEGKMYGRNELIARYIKLRTGKTRTRKQVSSHIQVLARRKAREIQVKLKDQVAKDKVMQSMSTMSSAQIISATAFQNKMALQGLSRPTYPTAAGQIYPSDLTLLLCSRVTFMSFPNSIKPFSQQNFLMQATGPPPIAGYESASGLSVSWQGRSIASSNLRMLEFSAFLEQPQDPETVNKHLFVHIGQSNPTFSDPYLEAVDVRQIYDKFPEKKGGLKELFQKGPANAFFLVKFW
ncbi:transcriptional enhancer factor TEF-3-like, partial [Sinocyclocheilus rhinocerous]|uniref:transcriptional enhancer factor TEF-3-like n=1 Tax=Sinocyclocheilus rhinocerous TaxID=307959 RepID=UPI0007B99979